MGRRRVKPRRCDRCGAPVYIGFEFEGQFLGRSCKTLAVREREEAGGVIPSYRFCRWPDSETCSRCGETIHSGWVIDDAKLGPTCGPVVLREQGIDWPAGYGPGSFDAAAMSLAVHLNEWRRGRWTASAEEREEQERIVGSVGWRIAQALALGRDVTFVLETEDALRCYRAARLGLAPHDSGPARAAREEERGWVYEQRLANREAVFGLGGHPSEVFLEWEERELWPTK